MIKKILLILTLIFLLPNLFAINSHTFSSLDEKLNDSNDTIRIIVKLKDDSSKAFGPLSLEKKPISPRQIEKLQNTFSKKINKSKHNFKYIPYSVIEVNKEDLNKLKELEEVEEIFEDKLSKPLLDDSVQLIGLNYSSNYSYSGKGQTVVVLDTGIDKNHPFLSGKVVSEACYSGLGGIRSFCPEGALESTDVNSGLNCPSEVYGCDHGTHVGGIVAGNTSGLTGVARDATIISIQVFSKFSDCSEYSLPSPCALSYNSDQLKGLERAYELKDTYNISAVSISIGGGDYSAPCDSSFSSMKAQIDLLKSAGIATIIASGNNGFSSKTTAPSCISSAISIGSTTKADAISSFSNSAYFLDFLAPGSSIYSSVLGTSYSTKSGTSMATPHVSGAFAVLKSKSPLATVDDIYNALNSTGVQILDGRNGITKSRIQIDAALSALETSISSCTNITYPGKFNLQNDLSINATCFNILSDNVIFDCNNNEISSISSSSIGFNLTGSNVSIINCDINFLEYGIIGNNSNHKFENISIYFNDYNFNLENPCSNSFINVTDYSGRKIDSLTTNLSNENYSDLFMCNLNNLVLTNLTIHNYLFFENISDSNLTNLSIYNNFEIKNSSNNYFSQGSFYYNLTLNNSHNNTFNSTYFSDNLFLFNSNYNNFINLLSNIENYTLQNSSNNFFKDNDFYSLNIDNISMGNTFTQNSFQNSSLIFVNNSFNFFNSSLSGFNLGNYWPNTFICLLTEDRGDYNVCANPSINNITSNVVDYAPLNTNRLIIPQMNIISPLNNSNYSTKTLSINISANFTEDISYLSYTHANITFDITNQIINNNIINTSIDLINFDYNQILFNFTSANNLSNNYILYVNLTLTLNSSINDSDGDGILDENDTLEGFSDNINTNLNNLSVEINNSTNLSSQFNSTLLLELKENNNTIIELFNNFSSNPIDLTNITLKKQNSSNLTSFYVRGLKLETNKTKSIYLNLIGNTSKYSSICLKDSIIYSFDDLSNNCSGLDEIYVHSIPYSNSIYSINFTDNFSNRVKISGLTHSGVSQVCTENWQVGSWGTCSSGTQSRSVTDLNSCGTTFEMPSSTQSCTSGGGSGGSGGGGSSSNSNDEDEEEIIPKEIIISNSIIKPKNMDKNKVFINGVNNLDKNYSYIKKIIIKDDLNQRLLSFNHNFTKEKLNLEDLEIISEDNFDFSYVIIKGLEGKNKTIYLDKLSNSGKVCISDREINSVNDLSSTCEKLGDIVIACDGKLKENKYICNILNNQYEITGLTHSSVFEFKLIGSNQTLENNPISAPLINNVSNNSIIEENSTTVLENNNFKFNKLEIALSISFIVLIIIIVISIILIKKRKQKKSQKIFEKVENYVLKYKDNYSKESIRLSLINAQISEKVINKVLKKYFKD